MTRTYSGSPDEVRRDLLEDLEEARRGFARKWREGVDAMLAAVREGRAMEVRIEDEEAP